MTQEIHYVILAAVLTLVGKIIWDWLSNRNNGRHHDRTDILLVEINERQKKMWEHMLEHSNNVRGMGA